MPAATALTANIPLPVSPQTFYFSMSMTRECLGLAVLIGKFGVSSQIEDGSRGTYVLPRSRLTKEPVFRVRTERRGGGYDQADYVGKESILNYLRRYALRKQDPMDDGLNFTSAYNPQNIRFEWITNDRGVVCFDRSGREVFRGPLSECPWPVEKYLELSRQSSAWEIAAWEICPIDNYFTRFPVCGAPFISNAPAPAVLMPDEAKLFMNGKDRCLVVQDSAVMACTWFDAYFSFKRRLYRLYAHHPD